MRAFTTWDSPLGTLRIWSDGEAVTALTLPVWRNAPPADAERREELPVLRQTRAWLAAYFAGEQPGALPPLRPEGTAYQRRVWRQMQAIPYGQTTSYGALAKALEAESGEKTSPRAVGGAVGRNPIAILLPCHRVMGADGSLTGFGGGLDAKVALLTLEGVLPRK